MSFALSSSLKDASVNRFRLLLGALGMKKVTIIRACQCLQRNGQVSLAKTFKYLSYIYYLKY
jgi:hypothetical protein